MVQLPAPLVRAPVQLSPVDAVTVTLPDGLARPVPVAEKLIETD
jgi:hypothetical protein